MNDEWYRTLEIHDIISLILSVQNITHIAYKIEGVAAEVRGREKVCAKEYITQGCYLSANAGR